MIPHPDPSPKEMEERIEERAARPFFHGETCLEVQLTRWICSYRARVLRIQ